MSAGLGLDVGRIVRGKEMEERGEKTDSDSSGCSPPVTAVDIPDKEVNCSRNAIAARTYQLRQAQDRRRVQDSCRIDTMDVGLMYAPRPRIMPGVTSVE